MLPTRRDPATRGPVMMAATIAALMGRCVTGGSLCFSEGYERERGLCGTLGGPPPCSPICDYPQSPGVRFPLPSLEFPLHCRSKYQWSGGFGCR